MYELPQNEAEAEQMVADGKLLRYYPADDDNINTKAYYLVDVFARDWRTVVDAYTIFVPGGLYFIVHGQCLKSMVKTCPADFEESMQPKSFGNNNNRKKMDVCFTKALDSRQQVINIYNNIFYKRPTNTTEDFLALCQRSRNNRYHNRMKFTFKVVKSLQCKSCVNNRCVYDALKLFYENDKKCEREVDYTASKHGGEN
ncbi:lef-2 [Spodoptera frugiperda granulovirus]|uniref:Lef-2 n=1 Tax=Spodoptera frugiperda granulovirus TaxID=307454 RepID=A0A0C5AQ57_9BBAC|nr:lef-2 [Spodoptera frugiperda granulovirus]AJK91691.1 lef-2 [Spodoptera frugiperda granulovirus]AXS01049.1 lef-2 [Spodoptera frugiperda granulovirus]